MSQCKQFFFHQLTFHKEIVGQFAVSQLYETTSKIVFTVVQIGYYYFTINIHNQLSEKYIEGNILKRRVDITSEFILTIDESSWYHA